MSRKNENMNLDWRFHYGDLPFPGYKGIDDSEWRRVTLPHDWSVEEVFDKKNASGTGYLPGGVGWYRKTFKLDVSDKDKTVLIEFDGVYNNAQVWINSYYLGKRPYGYSAFSYDLTPFLEWGEGENVISVKVDHKDIADSRWYTGSGIYRNVNLTIKEKCHINRHGIYITTELHNDEGIVSVQTDITNDSLSNKTMILRNTLLDCHLKPVEWCESEVSLSKGKAINIKQKLRVRQPAVWSVETPYLYTMKTELIINGKVADQVLTRTGVRSIVIDTQKGFFLNGKAMKLKGLCIHHDAGCLGAAVPQHVWRRRLMKFKKVGCNAIRMSHNPPASNLLDLCDEMGFLVIDEAFDEWEGVKNKWWQGHYVYPPKHYGYYEDFPEWHERDIKEMVLRDRNHPSIFSWSIGNEVDYPNDPYCHPSFKEMTGNNDKNKPAAERLYDPNKPNAERLAVIAKRLVTFVKECDESRPVTAALAFPELSNSTGYAEALDIVGYNYKEHLYDKDCELYTDRVIYGSENGKHLDAWRVVRDNDNICGQFLWTGIDFLGEAKGWPVRISQAGILDLTGRPKTSYYFRQSLWMDEPMVYITARDLSGQKSNLWDIGDAPHWNFSAGKMTEIRCYTNCDKVVLYLNGKTLGERYLDQCEESDYMYDMTWEVPYEKGGLRAVGYRNDRQVCEASLVTAGDPAKLKTCSDTDILKANGLDIAHIEVELVDDNGFPVWVHDKRITLSTEGPGEIIGIENGSPIDLEPYSSRQRMTYNGKLIAYVRSTVEVGTLKVIASCEDLDIKDVVLVNIKVDSE